MITAIVISTVHAKCLGVMMKSIEEYVPHHVEVYLQYKEHEALKYTLRKHKLHLKKQHPQVKSFGDAYNDICGVAFKDHNTILICNDDIVFDPTTFDQLCKDWQELHEHEELNPGYLAARSNLARGVQNVRWNEKGSKPKGLKYEHEGEMIQTDLIAPICAVISKHSWIPFLPINIASDDVQCLMMRKKGFQHFVSRAYVHHVGNQTVSYHYKEREKTMEYIEKHYNEYYQQMVRYL